MLDSALRRLLIVAVVLSFGGGEAPVAASSGRPQAERAAAVQDAEQASPARTAAGSRGATASGLVVQPDAARTSRPSGVDPTADGTTNYPPSDSQYHNYPEMVDHIHAVERAHPGIVQLRSIGTSYKGRTLWAAKISDNVATDEGKPEVFFDGLHHAREHLSAEMAIYVLDLLANNYGNADPLGQRVTAILNTRVIWIIFMVNPDGLQYDISSNPYKSWRKNRQPNAGTTNVGTDINRNYGYRWACCAGSSGQSDSETYRGPAPWSTPEARALRGFVESRVIGGVQRIRAHITFHAAGRQILWPFGYTRTDVPADMTAVDHSAFVAMARAMATTNGYRPEQSSNLYVTDGDQIDWMYATQRIFSFTFEMYPGRDDYPLPFSNRFYPPGNMVAALVAVNREAVLYLMEQADCPYRSIGQASAYCGPFYDDLEMSRGWQVNAGHTDTATAGIWARGVPQVRTYQLAANDGQAALVTGLKGGDVDGGSTSVRSALISLPGGTSTLRLRYWVGLDARATSSDSFVVRLVDASGAPVATALTVRGNRRAHLPAWKTLTFRMPASLRGTRVAIELLATDAGADSTVEAGVDTVRVTTP